ncbi:MAG: DM13 domain-containing protein [Candidatus Peregrinibacteria bacterium]
MKLRALSLMLPLLLAGCAKSAWNPPVQTLLANPLYAERYAADMVNRLTDMEIRQDPLLQDAGKKGLIERTKAEWLLRVKSARDAQKKGFVGEFVTGSEEVLGRALSLNDTLYFSEEFLTYPGPDLRVFLTHALDPRDAPFPDATSIDLGPIESPYGAKTLIVPHQEDPAYLRTVVLWDVRLQRLYGFAQLHKE